MAKLNVKQLREHLANISAMLDTFTDDCAAERAAAADKPAMDSKPRSLPMHEAIPGYKRIYNGNRTEVPEKVMLVDGVPYKPGT